MINANSVNGNSAESKVPSAFVISEIVITNAYGKAYAIKALVTKVTITESLYTLALTASLEIRDTVNLFEEIRISGQEKVEITIIKRDRKSPDSDKIKKVFYVSEVPLFGKISDSVQGFTLSCVSEHAFVNHLTAISRSAKGSIVKQISKIVTGDLAYKGPVYNEAESKGNVCLVIPNMKPFTAISWLLRHSYSNLGSPIYAYETLNGFKITSYERMTTSPSLGTYKFRFTQDNRISTKLGYEEMKYRIISMASNISSSKYLHAPRGAYSSTTNVVDISNKKFYEVKFDYQKQFDRTPTIANKESKPLLSNKFIIKNQPLNHHHDSLQIYINENSKAYEQYVNYHQPAIHSIGHHQSMLENLDNIKHNITLLGDLELSPGKKITIDAPKSIDPQVFKRVKDKDAKKSVMNDMMVTGDYLITSVRHIFDVQYKCELNVKRDYMYYNLDSAE
jgi:hypothetical protein